MPARTRRPPTRPRLQLQGSLQLGVDGRDLGGPGRLGLLRAVADAGSITQAAKVYGLSYKAAWEAIQAMNEASGQPLVERTTGGRGGGSTRLTHHGQRVLARYEAIEAVHQRYVGLLQAQAMDLSQEFSVLKVLNVKTSARNQWVAQVGAIRAGAVNDEVELVLEGGARLWAIVTHGSTEALGLALKQTVIVMVKASSVLLAGELGMARVSARNRLDGVVSAVEPGAVNAEVSLRCGSVPVVAIVPQAAVQELGLAPGTPVTALVQASDVLLATVR